MKRLALALACMLGAAQATTVPTLTLADQAKKAQVIVRGQLGPVETVKDGDVTYLAYPLEVTEVVAGDPAALPQLKGKPALMVLQGLQDLPALAPKQEAVMLLYTARLDSPFVGFHQGWYPITDGKVTAGDINDWAKLREAIVTARGTK